MVQFRCKPVIIIFNWNATACILDFVAPAAAAVAALQWLSFGTVPAFQSSFKQVSSSILMALIYEELSIDPQAHSADGLSLKPPDSNAVVCIYRGKQERKNNVVFILMWPSSAPCFLFIVIVDDYESIQ